MQGYPGCACALRRVFGAMLLVRVCALPGAAQDFDFSGPAAARNFQPIQLIFLNLPFERAATVPVHDLDLRVESAESNVIAITRGRYESTLKFETNRTVLAARYGVAPHWEVGLDVPFISRFGGFLDPVIDEVEYIFGLGNPERDVFPNNSFGGFFVRRNGQNVFEGDHETFQLGDLWFSAKREFYLWPPFPLIALRAAVKFPTGDEEIVTGSGKADFGAGLAVDYQALRRLALYLNTNFVYPLGPITPVRLTLNPIVTESFAAELALTQRLFALLHQAVYTSPMHGTGTALLDDPVVELGLGLNYAWSERLVLQALAINNVSEVEQAADFTLLIAVRWRWQCSPFAA